jgi:ABC-2 type transport system permease protein
MLHIRIKNSERGGGVNRISAVARKEFLHIRRDKRTLMLIVLMPFIQLITYGYAINTDVKHLSTVLYDQDRTSMSRRLVDALEQSAYFDVVERADSFKTVHSRIDRGKAKAGLIIPPNFSKDLLAGRSAKLQLLIDGTDSSPANAALNTSQAIVTSFMLSEGLVPVQVMPIDFRPRLWYNPDLKSSFFMVPGLVGLLLQLLIPMITASAIVREKERGNIEQLLVTPIKPYELIIGKLLPYVAIGLLIAFSIIVSAWLLFHVPIRGNPLTLFVLTMLFLVVCLGIGLFASTIADNQQQASQIIMFFAAPSILLSGFIFPRENMPWPVFYIGFMIPLTYFLKIVRGIILKGLGYWDLMDQIAPLVILAVLILFFSIRRVHKRLN